MVPSGMEFPRLETFIRVAESGSFNKAAESGNITSTAVIKQMNLLEDEVGVKLFDRTHRGLKLTKAGESFLKDSKYIIKYSFFCIISKCIICIIFITCQKLFCVYYFVDMRKLFTIRQECVPFVCRTLEQQMPYCPN